MDIPYCPRTAVKHPNFRGLTAALITATLLLLAGCDRPDWEKMDAHEQGSLEQVKKNLDFISKQLTRMEDEFDDYRNKDYKGNARARSRDLKQGWQALEALAKFSSYFARTGKKHGYLIYPESMARIRDSQRSFFNYGYNFANESNLPSASDPRWVELIKLARGVRKSYRDFTSTVRSRPRKSPSLNGEYFLSAQLRPIPLRLDFLSGEVRLSHTFNLASLSLTAQAGVGSLRSGIKTIIVRSDRGEWHYATGGRNIRFRIKESIVDIAGSVMIITEL